MRRLIQTLRRALLFCSFALACTIAVGAGVLYALEKSGWLRDWLRADIQGRLSNSGAQFELGELELDWFAPAILLHNISLGVDGNLIRLNRAVLELAPFAPALDRVKRVRIDGGRVRLSQELFAVLASLGPGPNAAGAGSKPRLLDNVDSFPPIEINGVQFDVRYPQWGDFPLGSVDALFARDEHARAELKGVLAPSLAESDDRTAAIYLRGRVERPGILSVHLSTTGFPISASALPPGTQLEALRAWQPTGRLALDAEAELSIDPSAPSSLSLRAKLLDGSLTSAQTGLSLRNLEFDIDAAGVRELDRDWLDPRCCSALVKGSGHWKDATLETFARLGQAAGPARWMRAELNAHDCDVSPQSLAEIGLWSIASTGFQALDPHGKADVAIAAALDERGDWSGAIDVRLDGRLGASYCGFPARPGFSKESFPLPVEKLRGRVCAAFDHDQVRAFQLGLLGISAEPADESPVAAKVGLTGVIAAAPSQSPADQPASLLLDFKWEGLSPGAPIRKAVEGLSGTAWIWPAFRPVAGNLDGSGRLMSDSATGGVAGKFEINCKDLQVTWEGLPVPLDHGQGKIELHFDPRALFGITFDVSGTTPTAESVRLRGRVQQDPALAPAPHLAAHPTLASGDATDLLMYFDVAVRGMALRGSDREVLAATWSGVGTALDMFQPSGKADVNLRAVRGRPRDELDFQVEIEPRQVQLTPKSFSTPTKNVIGRVLVEGAMGSATRPSTFTTRIAPLIGDWPQEARVACSAVFPNTGSDHINVRGAGIDVTNRALVGAFREAFAGGQGGRGFDLKALSIDGRIDFAADVAITPAAETPSRNEGVYRVFLRDNAFRNDVATAPKRDAGGGFALSNLWGELVQHDGVLTGEHIQARLGSTPVALNDARFADVDGTVHFTTHLQAQGLPLDREHLSLFLDTETVNAAIDRLHLSGWIDFEDARLEYIGKSSHGIPRLALSGEVRPRDAYVDLGLPLSIQRAQVDLSELVLEEGHVRAWAKVSGLDGRIANRQLEGARMLLTYIEPRLSLLDLSGKLEGGRISDLAQVNGPDERARTSASGPAFTMDLLEPYRFELGLALRDVQNGGLLRGMFQSEFADSGVLDAEIRLEGSLDKLTGIVGDGWVHMRNTRLWSIPVMRDLLSQFGLDSSAVFERMKSRFSLEGGVIHMDAIHVESPLLQLVGSGTLDLDGRLKHDLEARFALVDSLGPLTRLVYWIQNNLLSVSVRGDMSRPQIVLHGVLSFLHSNDHPKRELPLPSLSPLPARF